MIGKTIKSIRQEMGLSANELARRSGVSQPYLSQLETGKNDNPTPKLLRKIAKGLNIEYLELLDRAGHLVPIDYVDIFGENNPFLFKQTDSNGVKIDKELSLNEIRQLTDLNKLLNTKIDIYYKEKRLNNNEKEKILTMLQTLFE